MILLHPENHMEICIIFYENKAVVLINYTIGQQNTNINILSNVAVCPPGYIMNP